MNRRRTLSNRCSLLSALTLGHRFRREVSAGSMVQSSGHVIDSYARSVAEQNHLCVSFVEPNKTNSFRFYKYCTKMPHHLL
jgi:hypothetical protein